MDEIEVTRNGRTDQFSITLVRGADTIRCMVSVALGGAPTRVPTAKSIGLHFRRLRRSPMPWIQL